MARGICTKGTVQSVADFMEGQSSEVKAVRRKPSGRPSKGEVRKISLSIPVEVYEGVELASYFFKGNVTEYINTAIRRDLFRNLEKYREFKAILEDLSEGMQEEI